MKTLLDSYGIKTTPKCKYEFVYVSNKKNTVTFTANGDWLAAFSILFKRSPTMSALLDNYGDDMDGIADMEEDLKNYANQYPTAKALIDNCADQWSYLSETRVALQLTNLSTNTVLWRNTDYQTDISDANDFSISYYKDDIKSEFFDRFVSFINDVLEDNGQPTRSFRILNMKSLTGSVYSKEDSQSIEITYTDRENSGKYKMIIAFVKDWNDNWVPSMDEYDDSDAYREFADEYLKAIGVLE